MDDHYGPGQRGQRGESWRFFAVEQKVAGVPRRAEVLIPVDQELHAQNILAAAKFAIAASLNADSTKVVLSQTVSCLFTDADADAAIHEAYNKDLKERE